MRLRSVKLSPEAWAALWFAFALVFLKKWDPPAPLDSLWYAAVAKNLHRTGDYFHFFVARGSLDPFYDHMPLTYWITAAAFDWLGPSEFTSRLYPMLGSFATYAIVYALGRRWGGPFQGLLALVFYALCTEGVKWNGALLHDVPLTTYCLASVFFFLLGRDRSPYWYASGLCFALAVLTKGPIAFAVPLAIGLWLLVRLDFACLKSLHFWAALTLSAAVLALPLLPQLAFDGKSIYWHFGQAKAAYASTYVQSAGALFTYFGTLIWTAPLTVAGLLFSLPLALKHPWRREMGLVALMAGCFFVPLSAFHVKFPHYLLPMYPCLGLLACVGPAEIGKRYQPGIVLAVRGLALVAVLAAASTPWKISGKRNKEELNLIDTLKFDRRIQEKKVYYAGAWGTGAFFPAFQFYGGLDLQNLREEDLPSVDWRRSYVIVDHGTLASLRQKHTLPGCLFSTNAYCVLTDPTAVEIRWPSDVLPHERY